MKLISLLLLLPLLTGCVFGGGLPRDAALSQQVLLSIYYPGAGMGTRAMCAGAEVYVYRDGIISIVMPNESFDEMVEIARIPMTAEHYADLAAFAQPEKIARLRVREAHEVCDGNSRYITLYRDGEDGKPTELLRKGGYMPQGKAFQEMYRGIRERLDAYEVEDLVRAWREGLE